MAYLKNLFAACALTGLSTMGGVAAGQVIFNKAMEMREAQMVENNSRGTGQQPSNLPFLIAGAGFGYLAGSRSSRKLFGPK